MRLRSPRWPRPGARREASPRTDAEISRLRARGPPPHRPSMEFLNFLIIGAAAWLVWRRPERERLAFGLLLVSCVLMAVLFLVGTHTSFVPGVNL